MRTNYSVTKLIVFIVIALLAIVILYLSYSYLTEGFAGDIREVREQQDPV